MFNSVLTVTFLLGQALPLHAQYSGKKVKTLHWESCNYGDTLENKCNKCVCAYEGLYECEPKQCQPTDREVHFNNAAECHPNRLYYQGSTSCICTPKGQWPHSSCRDMFNHLPKDFINKRACEPHGYVRVDCNVCRCDDKGDVDSTRCTANKCKKDNPRTRKSDEDDTASLFTTCEVKNWYSMAACQFCYCLDSHKLICSTGINKQSNMPMGKYHLALCGPGLLKEVAALVPQTGAKKGLRLGNKPIDAKYWHQDVLLPQSKQITESQTEEQYQEIMQTENNYESKDFNLQKKYEPSNGNDDKSFNAVKRYQDDNYENYDEELNEIKINLTGALDGNEALTEEPAKSINFKPMDLINKIMQFRRSLTLDPRAKCVPGTVTSVNCNICHCLKNGKLLCTNKKCD